MPYPNEHSARLKDPKDFNPDTFRRKADGTIYGKIKVPSTISVIRAKLKGRDKPGDKPIPQALRFPTKSWTAQKARDWLKKNNIKYQAFEPASGGKSQQNSAPMSACIFSEDGGVCFNEKENDENGGQFKIIAYSGKVIVKHWFWGNLAFDLDGTRFAQKRMPVLEEHGRANRIGFSTSQEIKDQVILEGVFLTNELAQRLRRDLKEGFPMQASAYWEPQEVEYISKDQSAEVNGHRLKGPGTIFRKTVIREVSMCTLGADSQSSSESLTKLPETKIEFKERNIMENEEVTAETFADDNPELFTEITQKAKAEGEQAGIGQIRSQFAKFAKQFGRDPKFCMEQFAAGVTLEQATAAYAAKCEKERDEIAAKMSESQQRAVTVDPAVTEFSDEQKETTTAPEKKLKGPALYEHEFNEAGFDGKTAEQIQTEFADDPKSYCAYRMARDAGRVRVISGKSQ